MSDLQDFQKVLKQMGFDHVPFTKLDEEDDNYALLPEDDETVLHLYTSQFYFDVSGKFILSDLS